MIFEFAPQVPGGWFGRGPIHDPLRSLGGGVREGLIHDPWSTSSPLARMCRPRLRNTDQFLADLANQSVPNCLTGFKKLRGGVLDKDALELDRVHQFYRTRVEHVTGKWNKWGILNSTYRSHNLVPLKHAVRIIPGIRNIKVALFRCLTCHFLPLQSRHHYELFCR